MSNFFKKADDIKRGLIDMLDIHHEYIQLLRLIKKYIEQETGERLPLPKRVAAPMIAHSIKKTPPLPSYRQPLPEITPAKDAIPQMVKQPAAVTDNPPKDFDIDTIEKIEESIQGCTKCHLAQYRNNIVLGTGNPDAQLMIIGEAPGEKEDMQGEPFVGDAGQLLTKMLAAIHIKREDVYITNVVKCRPQGNRNPNHDEIEACNSCLIAQIRVVKPKIILCMGNFAAKTLLKKTEGISTLRGKFFDYHGIKLLPTYHPAALLYHPAWKRDAWVDMQLLQKELEG
ncbi:uracil-DNA glycosylase [bacterium]|nr:uracil-DNA glycosylase [bacterium]MBU1753903.1 uracil-DNA glycosylase [bacterium]